MMTMQLESQFQWAFSDDIPGSRCGPEDGPWPRPYLGLDEHQLWKELGALAKPQSARFGYDRQWRVDSLNFQPCVRARTQDRYVVRELNIHGQKWQFTGVFDGHLGDTTVEHVAHHLPIIVSQFLCAALEANPNEDIDPKFVSDLFSRSIIAFDNAIAQDVLDLFGGIENLRNLSDEHISSVINDQHKGGVNFKKTRLCMYGTTAVVALVDPEHENLWVANVGDCQALLVTPSGPDGSGDECSVELLTTIHNGDNSAEVARVLREHPDEPECVIDDRVLGALAPTRCLGDIPFKQPPEFSRRILYNLLPGFHDHSPWEEFLARNRTPPYISAIPEVIHRSLVDESPRSRRILLPILNGLGLNRRKKDKENKDNSSQNRRQKYLILGSDGFADLCPAGVQQTIKTWARKIWEMDFGEKGGGPQANLALNLLREALGGDDSLRVSRVLTLNMDEAWIDDTALVVQAL